jgi:hypothetical protein
MSCAECKERCRGRRDFSDLDLRDGDELYYGCYRWMDEIADRKNELSIWDLDQIRSLIDSEVHRIRREYPNHKNMLKRAAATEEILNKVKSQTERDIGAYEKKQFEAILAVTKKNDSHFFEDPTYHV